MVETLRGSSAHMVLIGLSGHKRELLLPRDWLVMVTALEADLPLEHGLHEQPHHRAPGQGGHPFGLLQPHRPHSHRVFAPAQAGGYGDIWRLIGLE
jgi:hypothetical protein